MFANSHFALGTHVLAALAINKDTPLTSTMMAQSVNTNPAFLRVLLGQLKQAGLIEIALGKGGGARLAKPAKDITLLDIYRAVETKPAMRLHQCEPDASCLVGRNILPILEGVMQDVDEVVATRLTETTLQDLARQIRKRG